MKLCVVRELKMYYGRGFKSNSFKIFLNMFRIFLILFMLRLTQMNQLTSQQVILCFNSKQINNLYEMDVQVSQFLENQQNQEGISPKCLQYIAKIQQNLQGKYQSIGILQMDTNQIGVKRKKIKKVKEYKDINLKKKIKKHKQYLNKIWARRLFRFLKVKLKNRFTLAKINHLQTQMASASTINQLSKIFQQNPWVGEVIHNQKQNFLNFINKQKISGQTKLLLFQTFDLLLEGTKHPENLVSWDHQINRNIKESKQLLEKFKDKSHQEIHEIALLQYSRQKEHYQNNKCSPHNNISYFWFKYIKEIFESKEFKLLYHNHQIYKRLQYTFAQSATIANIRDALSIEQLAQYILKIKIESKQILSQLVLSNKMNLLNKVNMVMTLSQFINAVKDPITLHRWN